LEILIFVDSNNFFLTGKTFRIPQPYLFEGFLGKRKYMYGNESMRQIASETGVISNHDIFGIRVVPRILLLQS